MMPFQRINMTLVLVEQGRQDTLLADIEVCNKQTSDKHW